MYIPLLYRTNIWRHCVGSHCNQLLDYLHFRHWFEF